MQVSLLSDTNFGPGKKPSLVKLAENLLSSVSNTVRINSLIEFGWLQLTDTEMANAMLHFSFADWKEFASQLLKVKIVPGRLLSLEIDLPAETQFQPVQDMDPKRHFSREITYAEARFNEIVAVSQRGNMRLERYSILDQLVRNQPLLPSVKAHNSVVCWAVAVTDSERTEVVLKLRNTHDKDSLASTLHEFTVLQLLQKTAGIPRLHGDGLFYTNSTPYLVMLKESNDSTCLETLSVSSVFGLIRGLFTIVSEVHSLGLLHNNLHAYNLMYDSQPNAIVMAGFQYASIDPEAPESVKQRCRNYSIRDQSPLKGRPINIAAMDEAPKCRAHDCFQLGTILLSLMGRDLQMFSKRRHTDLSSLDNLSQQQIAVLVIKHAETFNYFIDPMSVRLGQREISLLVQLCCGLLHADPNLRLDAAGALAILDAHPNLQPQIFPKEMIVPARFVECLQEFQRPTKIKTCTDCVDPAGNVIEGKGLFSFGQARAADLLALYAGMVYTKQEGDMLTANGLGTNLKSIIINGQDMVMDARLETGSFADINFFVTNGPAGLTNCNALVQVKRDGKGGRRIKVTKFPANAYFEIITLSKPYKLPLPGCHWTNQVIVLRAARDLENDEQIFVEYGTGAMMKMFGVCSGEIVISKPVAKVRAQPKRKHSKKAPSRAKHSIVTVAQPKRQRVKE